MKDHYAAYTAKGGEVMDKLRWQLKLDFPLDAHAVALYRIGSHSHGTHIPPEDPNGIDDTDYMLILAPPRHRVYGLRPFQDTSMKAGDLEVVVYSWDKYVRLLLKSNPNVLGTLWLEEEDRVRMSPPWVALWREREAFLSKFVYTTFCGYARSQLKKMTHFAHQGYMGEKRKALVAQWGYDVKNAAHLIRLLRMGCEALREGTMHVRRADAEELKAIKRGEWPLERVQAESEAMFSKLASEYGQSKLPEYPDERAAERLLLEGYETMWGRTP